MSKQAKAVVCREWNKPVVIETVTVESPRRGEVMVKIAACGVCHSDLSATNGTIPLPPPLVLGHEAAGTVVEVGDGVSGLAAGDPVVVSWVATCGRCSYCVQGRPALCDNGQRATVTLPDGTRRIKDSKGQELNHFAGVAVMAEYATLPVENVIKIGRDIPLDKAALVGCAVMTGVGAAINTAQVQPGSSVAVLGAGGIGLNVIQGAALAGAHRIIAIDMADSKLALAKEFGATDVVNPSRDGDAVMKVMAMTAGGADYAFECIGIGTTIAQAYNMVRKGGKAIVVGVSKPTDTVTLGAFMMPFQEKTLIGSMYGSARPSTDFPRLLNLYKDKRLKLDELVTAVYGIDDVNRAFEDMQSGANARGIIVF
ncbi:S-(hydroxymethyl)glutathione dehydrogenase / alcohol dehydrogenase [Burkholderiales bacterium]|jgi:S-(hydroxymethyl)glutathione dehydrogenase/alcohol dehydrogenase|nr:S-(hydroxymethyl)glutathione dehydrogenase / alcohol dehydrogenase [Burkholderiales bacterium]